MIKPRHGQPGLALVGAALLGSALVLGAALGAAPALADSFVFGPRPSDAAHPEVYDHLNPERFSANPPAPFDPYYAYPHLNTPQRAYPYGWFGARSRTRDNYLRGARGYPIHSARWPGR